MVTPHSVTAIILCGGMGTRLHAITKDQTAKPMVDVAGKPFLQYLLDYCLSQGITQVVMAVGHHRDVIMAHFGHHYGKLSIEYSIEESPLGTGGALKQAMQQPLAQTADLILALNGDSFIAYDLNTMTALLDDHHAQLVMALRPLENTGRYGRVTMDADQKLTGFEEKKGGCPGTINSGVYLLRSSLIESLPSANVFSFETDFLEKEIGTAPFYGSLVSSYFIDIGTPDDYQSANLDFAARFEALTH